MAEHKKTPAPLNWCSVTSVPRDVWCVSVSLASRTRRMHQVGFLRPDRTFFCCLSFHKRSVSQAVWGSWAAAWPQWHVMRTLVLHLSHHVSTRAVTTGYCPQYVFPSVPAALFSESRVQHGSSTFTTWQTSAHIRLCFDFPPPRPPEVKPKSVTFGDFAYFLL